MTQLYRITRRGVVFSRLEWPNGEPVRSSRYKRNATGNFETVKRDGQAPVRVYYGTKPGVRGIRNEIRLTPAGAQSLKHLGLVPVLGASVKTKQDKEPPTVNIPDDWQKLNREEMSKLACSLVGQEYELMNKKDATEIIEAFLSEQNDGAE